MARFTYKVKDVKGANLRGLVEAVDLKQAARLLHERGYFIIQIKEAKGSLLSVDFSKSKISFNDLVHFTRQLSTMITAGLTLVEALAILRQQISKPAVIKLVNQLEDDVRGGMSFFDALEKHSKIFPSIYLALIRAGEASGNLDKILSRLADNLEKSQKFKNKVRGALIYPAIVVIGMTIVTFIVMTVVVPRLTSLYKEFGVELPLATQILISISSFLIKSWWWMLLLVVIGGVFFLKWKQTFMGKHILALAVLRLPVFGHLISQSTLVETTRTMSILVDSGVPILTALEIAQDATGNVLYKEALSQAAKKVEKGFSLSEYLSASTLFPPILSQMVAVGEQTGKLGDALLKLSHYFETEAEAAIRNLTTMIEPLIMVVLGLGVAFLVMAVLLPIYSLTSQF